MQSIAWLSQELTLDQMCAVKDEIESFRNDPNVQGWWSQPVVHEPFHMWQIEDRAKSRPAALQDGGVNFHISASELRAAADRGELRSQVRELLVKHVQYVSRRLGRVSQRTRGRAGIVDACRVLRC